MNPILMLLLTTGFGLMVLFLFKAAWAIIRFILKILVVIMLIGGFVNSTCFSIAIGLVLAIIFGNFIMDML
jgi:hypothetical protein